jgi:chemotaxis protein MotB
LPKLSLPDDTGLLYAPVRRALPTRRHRGAWKVAYADFATALLALFIVLWLMSATEKVKKSVAGYFRDPRGYTINRGGGAGNVGEKLLIHRDNVAEIREQIQLAISQMPEFPKLRENVLFSVTGEGLRIDLLETEQGMFFVTGGNSPTPAGERLLKVLATELAAMPNLLVVEGHTDASPFRDATPDSGYSNWELAADRANAARRLLHTYGVRPSQIVEVRGFADQHLLHGESPGDPRNRRVSVVVKFSGPDRPPN